MQITLLSCKLDTRCKLTLTDAVLIIVDLDIVVRLNQEPLMFIMIDVQFYIMIAEVGSNKKLK